MWAESTLPSLRFRPLQVLDGRKPSASSRAILKAPPFIERHLASRGYEVVAGTGAELATAIREEVATVVEMI